MTGSIIASCGHKLGDDEDSVSVRYRDVTCDAIEGFSNCVVYAEFCPKCAAEWATAGRLTVEEEEVWLRQ